MRGLRILEKIKVFVGHHIPYHICAGLVVGSSLDAFGRTASSILFSCICAHLSPTAVRMRLQTLLVGVMSRLPTKIKYNTKSWSRIWPPKVRAQ